MQNTTLAHRAGASRKCAFLASITLLICLFAFPSAALAQSYSIPEVDIQAQVEADGSLHVCEQRTFEFRGQFTCVWWEFDNFSGAKRLSPDTVCIGFPHEPMHYTQPLEEVDFETSWRSEGGPGKEAYSFDAANDAIYVFFDAADTEMVVTLEYTIEGAVDLYTDTAELYWQFIGSSWAEDSRNVACTIELPARGQRATPEKDVFAWGHGPLDGKVGFDETGTVVTLEAPKVRAGEFAEARILFPLQWIDDASACDVHEHSNIERVREAERREAARANRGRIFSLIFFGVLGLASFASIAWSAIKLVLDGIEHKPNFADSYWRDVPSKGVHPATVGRLCRWNKESSDDVLATILHLANEGAISINKGIGPADGPFEPAALGSSGQAERYYLRLNRDVANRLADPIDTRLVKFLFGEISKDGEALWLDEIGEWGKGHEKSFDSKLRKWQKAVSDDVNQRGYFEEKGRANQEAAWSLGMVLVIAGVFISVEIARNFWPLIALGAAGIVVLLLSINMPRRTQEGADVYARAMGLKKWLRDFTLLDERIPTDVKVWGEFMVYAQLFGVAEETVRQLRSALPELFAVRGGADSSGSGAVSWSGLYVDDGPASSREGAFSNAFSDMWSNTVSAVEAATSASSGSGGSWSSGDGGGGGFSGGGGGGFGGGGGGAR